MANFGRKRGVSSIIMGTLEEVERGIKDAILADCDLSSNSSENGEESSVSDCESVTSDGDNDKLHKGVTSNGNNDGSQMGVTSDGNKLQTGVTNEENNPMFDDNGLIRLDVEDRHFKIIRERFMSGMGSLSPLTTVVAVHRKHYSSVTEQARHQSFLIHAHATARKCGGNANVKHLWYGAPKEGIQKILAHGFGKPENSGLYGDGIYLCPNEATLECARNLCVDDDGLRHLLLCRVILGKMEVVHPGSIQSHPSSKEFDSGVDNLSSPKRYIVWSSYMNTHIVPDCVVSFRAPHCLRGALQMAVRNPNAPRLLFTSLFSELSSSLPQDTMRQLVKHHTDYTEGRMSRYEMIQRLRRLSGDELLLSVVRSMDDTQQRAPHTQAQQRAPRAQISLSSQLSRRLSSRNNLK